MKLADNAHNLGSLPELAERDPEAAERLREKYEPARDWLKSCGSREDRAAMIEALEGLWRSVPRKASDSDFWPSMADLDEMDALNALRREIDALRAIDSAATDE